MLVSSELSCSTAGARDGLTRLPGLFFPTGKQGGWTGSGYWVPGSVACTPLSSRHWEGEQRARVRLAVAKENLQVGPGQVLLHSQGHKHLP
jgi:hypothetical protein